MTSLAYIDPGLGALIWQAVVAAFIGFLFYLRKTRRWIVDTTLKIFGREQKPVTPVTPKISSTEVDTKTDER